MCQALFEVLMVLHTHEPSVLMAWVSSKHRRKYVTVLGSGHGCEQVEQCNGRRGGRVDGKHLGRLLSSIPVVIRDKEEGCGRPLKDSPAPAPSGNGAVLA